MRDHSINRRPRTIGWAAGASVLLLMAACGESSPTAEPAPDAGGAAVPAESTETEAGAQPEQGAGEDNILTYSGEDRSERLLAGAAEEGSLTWYTSLAGDVVTAIEEGFEAEHPDVDVEVLRASSTDIVERVTQEGATSQVQADVFEFSSDSARILIEEEGIAGELFYSPAAMEVSDRFRVGEGDLTSMAADRISYISFGYSQEAVGEVPDSFEDYLSPEFSGELAITASGTGVRWVGSVLEAMGTEDGEVFLQQLADQGMQVHGISGSALMELIGQGVASASPAVFRNHAQLLAADGLAVDWEPVELVTGNVGYAFLNGETPNPHAALLFMDYLLGDGGGQVLEEHLYAAPSQEMGFDVWIPDETYSDPAAYGQAYEEWQTTFDRIFG